MEMESTGLAYFPGLAKPVILDSRKLPEKEAQELERLVEDARVFERSNESYGLASDDASGHGVYPAGNMPMPGSADYRQYLISIQEGKQRAILKLAEPVEDPQLQKLLSYLKEIAETQKAKKKK
jgi:hypothetical protein